MEISIIQAVLCGIVYWLAVGNLPFVGLWSLQRPLVCGLVTGLILGHPVQELSSEQPLTWFILDLCPPEEVCRQIWLWQES